MVISMSEKTGSDWAFKMMSLIHDNPIRRKFSSPYETLKRAGLKPGQTILEIGCGPGFFTIAASDIITDVGCVYALDIHPLAIKKIHEKMKKANKNNIVPLLKNVCKTDLPEESIDLTFLFGLPRLLRNESLFLKIQAELNRVLKNTGKMVIKSRSSDLVNRVNSELFDFIEVKDGMHHFIKNSTKK